MEKSTETQSQKYNGKNKYNNKVVVDFEKKNVIFSPVISNGSFETSTNIALTFNNLLLRLNIIITCALTFKHLLTTEYVGSGLGLIWIIWFLSNAFLKYPARLLNFWEKWDEVFPKVNAILISFTRLLKMKNPIMKVKILPHMIKENKIKIRKFDNVFLSYKAKGDFAKKIKNIIILPIDEYNPFDWEATFVFKEGIKEGEMEINYI